ncbi:Astacin-like metalloendopeptidase [Strongyloides ratti]|uniref:Metalloendopeptidase n=1 Tax=Strongyloides ratti TaxID=34506 RepID=A0A090MZH1_STRRB|nr:Astacin-like metalloendopeptidase [Strongyloides ratti]CEF68924.1 Astacin-like metalloendopeptidase [Strongyloides ratti]
MIYFKSTFVILNFIFNFYEIKSYFLKENNYFDSDIKRIYKRDVDKNELKWDFPIKYWVDPNLGLNENLIEKALQRISNNTCITWEKKESQILNTSGLNVVNRGLCGSFVGRLSKNMPQEITFSSSCFDSGRIEHEFSHALGLVHENKIYGFEKYITINYTNLQEKAVKKFQISNTTEKKPISKFYDYGSLLHHPSNMFSKNGLTTIITKDPNYQDTIGQDDKLKFSDIKNLNLLYCQDKCKKEKKKLKCKNGGYVDPKNCKKCRCPEHYSGTFCNFGKIIDSKCKSVVVQATSSKKLLKISGNLNCFYYIMSPLNTKIQLTIENSDLPNKKEGSPCIQGESLEILYKKDPSVVGAMFCGKVKNVQMKSEDNKVSIHYVGNSTNNFVEISYKKVNKKINKTKKLL